MRVIAGAVSLLVVLGALFYARSRQSAPSTSAPVEHDLPAEPPRRAPPFITRHAEPPSAPTSPAQPSSPDAAVSPPIKQALDAARAAMRAAAARDCRPRARDADQRLSFRYTLAIEHGSAHAAGVENVGSDIADEQLLKCLLDSLAAARWSYAGPDTTLTAEEEWPLGMLDR